MFPTTPPPKPRNPSRQQMQDSLCLAAQQNLQNVGRFVNQEGTISDLLAGPICVGENHSHQAPKKWFLDNLQTLKDNGFEVFFIEHLSPDLDYNYSPSGALDADRNLKEGTDLTKKLQKLDRGHADEDDLDENNFSRVVEKALQVGMKVVPLELSDKIYSDNKRGDDSRMIELNANALKIISTESANFLEKNGRPLKWVGFVGSAHLHTYCGVPGICDVLPNVVSLLVCEVAKGQEWFKIFNGLTGIFLPKKESASSVGEDLKSTGEELAPDLKVLAALFVSRESDLSFDAISRLNNSAPENKSVSSSSLKNDFSNEKKVGLFADSEVAEILPAPPPHFLKRKPQESSKIDSKKRVSSTIKEESNLFYPEQLQGDSPTKEGKGK